MAYVKTNWQTGDVITAAKLNNMETGIYDATEAAAAAFAPDIDDPQNGDVIKYNSTAAKWVNGAAFAPDISNPQDGQVLVYDGTAGKWVNGAASGGMVVPVLTTADHGEHWTSSHTYAEIAALITAGKCNQIKTVEEGITVYENLAVVEYPTITFCDIVIDENGACQTDYIITPDGISVVVKQYPQNPQNP